jgi:hypothetical protein
MEILSCTECLVVKKPYIFISSCIKNVKMDAYKYRKDGIRNEIIRSQVEVAPI